MLDCISSTVTPAPPLPRNTYNMQALAVAEQDLRSFIAFSGRRRHSDVL